MAYSYSPQLRKALIKRRSKTGWNIQQFGQSNDYYTFSGATGCTHTVLQWLIYLWTGKKTTHDGLSKIAGYPLPGRNGRRRGLRPSEVMRIVNHYGLPYQVRYGMSPIDIAHASKKGPVGFGHKYDWWPEWKGYHYGGRTSDGHPNGYAKPLGHAGRTQLAGFSGAHFGCLLGYSPNPDAPDKYYGWEPNHHSPSRPEKPAYDVMSYEQFSDVYRSYQTRLGRTLYALVPTKTLPAKGF